jgi:hypothetical protein
MKYISGEILEKICTEDIKLQSQALNIQAR